MKPKGAEQICLKEQPVPGAMLRAGYTRISKHNLTWMDLQAWKARN